MNGEPADLPFRKLEADGNFDALVYCPICRATEVQIVRTCTSHFNLAAVSDPAGFRVELLPTMGKSTDGLRYNVAGPWHCVLFLQCCNNHDIRVAFFTNKGMTWVEIGCDEGRRVDAPNVSSPPPTP